jgi:hypothetical protein
MGQNAVQRPRHSGEVQRVNEHGRRFDLPAAMRAEETPELILFGAGSPLGLSLEGAERFELSLRFDDPLDGGGAEGADQLVLQVRDAREETEAFHLHPGETGTHTGPLESASEVALLCGVIKAGQFDTKPTGTEAIEEAADIGRTPHRHDGNAFGVQVTVAPSGKRLERELVADAFD